MYKIELLSIGSPEPLGRSHAGRSKRKCGRAANINPDAPTPSGYVYYLPKPEGGDPVSYDDCQRKTGILFEYKGYYGKLLTFDSHAVEQILNQSARQIAASGGRPVVWIFAEEATAEAASKLFNRADKGRERIMIAYVPWTK